MDGASSPGGANLTQIDGSSRTGGRVAMSTPKADVDPLRTPSTSGLEGRLSKLYEENTTVRRGQTRLLIEKRSTDQRLNTSREENAKLRTQLSELQKANDRLNSAARQGKATGFFASLGNKLQAGGGSPDGVAAAAAITTSSTLSTAAAIALAMRGGDVVATPNTFDSKYLRRGVGSSGGRGGGGEGAMEPLHYPASTAASPIQTQSRPASAAAAATITAAAAAPPSIAVSPSSPARSAVSFRGGGLLAQSPTEALRAASEETRRLVERLEAENAALRTQHQQPAALGNGGRGLPLGRSLKSNSPDLASLLSELRASGRNRGDAAGNGGSGGGGGNNSTLLAEAANAGSLIDLLGRHCENLSADDPDLELVCVLVETVRVENRRLKEEAFQLRDDKHKLKRAMKKLARENDRLRESQLSAYDRSDKLVELTKSLITGPSGNGAGAHAAGRGEFDAASRAGYRSGKRDASHPRHRTDADSSGSSRRRRHRHNNHHQHQSSGTEGPEVDLEQENRVLRQQLKALLRGDLEGSGVGRW
eukprot:gene5411-20186_t